MSAQGSPYSRFRRALGTRNLTLALAAAQELPHVDLEDAAQLVLLLADGDDPDRFARAADRLHSRIAVDVELVPGESDLLRAALRALDSPARRVAAMTAGGIAALHQLDALAGTFDAAS